MKKAIAEKEVFLLFFFHKNNREQCSQLVSLCVRWAVDQHAVKGDSSQPLPFFSLHARKCVCEGGRGRRGILIQASNSPMIAEGHRLPPPCPKF